MICTGVLLLVAHYSIGNPVPRHRRSDERCGQNQASDFTCAEWARPDTNSTEDFVTQITNGISVYTKIAPVGGPVLSLVCIINIASEYILRLFNSLAHVYPFILQLGVEEYALGLQTVCRTHYLYLALNNTDESDDNYINYTSAYKYVAQRVMENACRWVSIILILLKHAGSNNNI